MKVPAGQGLRPLPGRAEVPMHTGNVFGLHDYVQMACQGQHSVLIIVGRGDDVLGRVLIRSGELWSAEDGSGEGDQALLRLALREGTWFDLRQPGDSFGERSITSPWVALLLEAARLSDEGGSVASTDPAVPTFPRVGDTLGNCLLTDCIGRGGTCVVFRALHRRLLVPVAVKVLLPTDSTEQAQGLSEADVLSALEHPGILKLLEVGGGAHPYLVLEHADGLSLLELIRQSGYLRPHRATRIFRGVAEALQYAYDTHGLLHRDLKPGNILLMRDGSPRLADFGLAAYVGTDGLRPDPTSDLVFGTAGYLPPERLERTTEDHRGDMYSFGASLFEALTGRPPFRGSWQQVLQKHLHQPPPPPHHIVEDLPKGLSRFVLRLLEKQPEERPESYQEVIEELASWEGVSRTASGRLSRAGPEHEWTSFMRAYDHQLKRELRANTIPEQLWRDALTRCGEHIEAETLFVVDPNGRLLASVGGLERTILEDLGFQLLRALEQTSNVVPSTGAADLVLVGFGEQWLTGLRIRSLGPCVVGVVGPYPVVGRKTAKRIKTCFDELLEAPDRWVERDAGGTTFSKEASEA